MKKYIQDKYGSPDVLKLVDAETPAPQSNEVLVRIHYTSVTSTECLFRAGSPYFVRVFTGFNKPKLKTLGEELAGVVEEVGKEVTRFKVGDAVFGTAGPKFGACAEYVCLDQDGEIDHKPDGISFEQAVCVDGFLTAMPFLRDVAELNSGQDLLIYGASGSIGTAAVQIAKQFGARVTGVCSTANVELVKSLGADEVIDYTEEDFTRRAKKYDIIFDAVGKSSFGKCKKVMKKDGVLLEVKIGLSVFPSVLMTSLFPGKKVKISATGLRKPAEKIKDLKLMSEWMQSGKFRNVVDRSYSFAEVPDAHRYVDKGHKKGNVVVRVADEK